MAQYEFETGTLSGCTIGSDGVRTFVENMTFVGSYVELNLNSITEGWYDLDVTYSQGLGDSISPYRLTVDNGNEYILYLTDTAAWNNFLTKSLPKVYLSAGTNILRFTQYGAPANLDNFELNFSTVQNSNMPERLNYWNEAGNFVTTPARQNIILTDTNFTSNNYNLAIGNSSNRALICENTVASTLTLTDNNWENNEPFAEIEIFRANGAAAIQLVIAGTLTVNSTSIFNIKDNGFAYLKHLKNKIWYIQGELE